MATLGLAVAGAAGFAMLGLPPGMGFALGATAGRMMFGQEGTESQTIYGPRIRDLRASDSALGAPVPICYGTCRVAGQYIWSPPIIETVNKTKERLAGAGSPFGKGGGGGGSITTVDYLYSMNAAVGICAGPITGFRRIWADTKLIFDATGDSAGTAARYYPFMRFYTGTEDQAPDTLIETEEGAGEVPAFRGLAYIVFDDFPLADFGNRRPTISAEIGTAAQTWPRRNTPIWRPHAVTPDGQLMLVQNPTPSLSGKNNITPEYDGWMLYDVEAEDNVLGRGGRGMISTSLSNARPATEADIGSDGFFEIYEGVGPRPLKHVSVIMATMDALASTVWTVELDAYERNLNASTGLITATSSGYLHLRKYAIDGTYLTESRWLMFYGFGDTLIGARVEAEHDLFLSFSGTYLLNWNKQTGSAWAPFDAAQEDGSGYRSWIADTATLQALAGFNTQLDDDPAFTIRNCCRSRLYPNDFWLLGTQTIGPDRFVGIRRVSPAGIPGPITLFEGSLFGLPPEPDAYSSMGVDGRRQRIFAFMEDHLRGMIYVSGYGILTEIDPLTLARTRSFVFNPDLAGTAMQWSYWHGAVADPWKAKPWSEQGQYVYLAREQADGYGSNPINQTNAKVGMFDLDAFDWQREYVIGSDRTTSVLDVSGGSVFYEPYSHSLIVTNDTRGVADIWDLDRYAGAVEGTTVEAIVRDICGRVGIAQDYLSFTGLDLPVQGYTLTRRSSALAHIEPLRRAYFFDGCDSDWLLKFRARSKASSATIALIDTAAGSPGSRVFSGVDSQLDYFEAPERIDVVFHDLDRDHQQNDAHAKRPRAGTLARAQETIDIPIVFVGPSEPKKIADISLLERWLLRPFSTSLGPKHLRIEPCDVITVNWRHGQAVVLVVETREQPGLVTGIDGVVIDSTAYTSYASTVAASVPLTTQVVPERGVTWGQVVQAPVLDPAAPGTAVYVGAGSDAAGWSGARMLVSTDDGISWQDRGGVSQATAVGLVVDAPSGGIATAIRDDSEMTVYLYTGTLEPAEARAVAEGSNTLAIGNNPGGWELVGFTGVTALATADRYRLTGLLRGRAGTEHMIDRIDGPLNAVLLDRSVVAAAAMDAAEIGATLLVRIVPVGGQVADVPTFELTYEAAGLLPWSPSQLTGYRSTGDLTFSWYGRKRIDNELRDYSEVELLADEVPETYQIDILDEDEAVVRTLTDTATANGSVLVSGSRTGIYELADAVADFGDEHGWRCNLLNADFEDAGLDGWTVDSGAFRKLASDGDLSAYRGAVFLSGGATYQGTDHQLSQTVDLRVEHWRGLPTGFLEAGALAARLSARQANGASDALDEGQITLEALDRSGAIISSMSSTLEPMLPVDAWQEVVVAIDPLPAETVRLVVRLRSVKLDGDYSNAAFDRVRLHLNGVVGQRSVVAYQLSTVVGRGHPGRAEI